MDPSIKHRLIHDSYQVPCTGQDSRGDKTFGPQVLHKAFRYGQFTLIKNLLGEDDVSQFQLIVDTIVSIDGRDEWIFQGKQYPVKSYSHFDGLQAGTGTTVVYL